MYFIVEFIILGDLLHNNNLWKVLFILKNFLWKNDLC